jgi:uncharacterized protein (DUF4415 family)
MKESIMRKKPKDIMQQDWDAVESPDLSEDMLSKMKPVNEKHPHIPRRVRRPQKAPLKIPISIRLSSDVINYFKSQGAGWQSKINIILRDYIKSHHAS